MRIILMLAVITLSGCASENVRVSCDGRLQPINPRAGQSAVLAPRGAPAAPGKPPAGQEVP